MREHEVIGMTEKIEISIDVEPLQKEFRLRVDPSTTASEILDSIAARIKDDGFDLEDWKEQKIGTRSGSIVLMRASEGFAVVPPDLTLEALSPTLEAGERFKLDARAYVG